MGIMDAITGRVPDVAAAGVSTALVETHSELAETKTQLAAERDANEILSESLADIELALEDRGWSRVGTGSDDITSWGRNRARDLCRAMGTANPLIKRGLTLRCAYVWGLGCTIQAKDTEEGQDINGVVQAFLEANRDTFSGSQARTRSEWALGTDGEFYRAGRVDRVTGDVEMSIIPPGEIDDIVCDPDRPRRPWYYLRTYRVREIRNGAVTDIERHVAYPALGYYLKSHPDSLTVGSRQYAMSPDTYVRHVAVNQPGESIRGIGDAFASLAWARAHKEFLEQWAILMRALARFAWKHKTPAGRAATTAQRLAASTVATSTGTESEAYPRGYGADRVLSEGHDIEAIPKTSATIDADSGKPLASYVAAGLGIPVTLLLGDPGQTGARAVAETLDKPTALEMGLRRDLHAEDIDAWCQFVIDASVKAPQGALKGRVLYDSTTRLVSVELPDQDDRTIAIRFPSFEKASISELAKAIADVSGSLPGGQAPGALVLIFVRQFLSALGEDDIDEALDAMTDDDGNFLDAGVSAGAVAAQAFRRGEDPAAAIA